MHISEGVLSAPVLASGAVLAAAGCYVGLKKIDYDKIARVGIMSSAFFVASLIHVNLGHVSVHLVLNGLVGMLLGWAAFPAILVALALQAIFFQFGGLTTLGINTFNMALPAVCCYYMFNFLIWKKPAIAATASFACGFISIALSAVMIGACLVFTQESFFETAAMIIAGHLPVMVIEGLIIAFCVGFLKKVQPDMLPGYESYVNVLQDNEEPDKQSPHSIGRVEERNPA